MPQILHFIAGHRVGEVAHDYVPVLKQWLTSEGIKNSYDSWHGTYFKITILNTLVFLMLLYGLLLSQKLLQYRIFPLCLTLSNTMSNTAFLFHAKVVKV